MLAEWVADAAAGERSAAWLSLNGGESDPTSFWTYVITALNRAAPGVGSGSLPLLQVASNLKTNAVKAASEAGIQTCASRTARALFRRWPGTDRQRSQELINGHRPRWALGGVLRQRSRRSRLGLGPGVVPGLASSCDGHLLLPSTCGRRCPPRRRGHRSPGCTSSQEVPAKRRSWARCSGSPHRVWLVPENQACTSPAGRRAPSGSVQVSLAATAGVSEVPPAEASASASITH